MHKFVDFFSLLDRLVRNEQTSPSPATALVLAQLDVFFCTTVYGIDHYLPKLPSKLDRIRNEIENYDWRVGYKLAACAKPKEDMRVVLAEGLVDMIETLKDPSLRGTDRIRNAVWRAKKAQVEIHEKNGKKSEEERKELILNLHISQRNVLISIVENGISENERLKKSLATLTDARTNFQNQLMFQSGQSKDDAYLDFMEAFETMVVAMSVKRKSSLRRPASQSLGSRTGVPLKRARFSVMDDISCIPKEEVDKRSEAQKKTIIVAKIVEESESVTIFDVDELDKKAEEAEPAEEAEVEVDLFACGACGETFETRWVFACHGCEAVALPVKKADRLSFDVRRKAEKTKAQKKVAKPKEIIECLRCGMAFAARSKLWKHVVDIHALDGRTAEQLQFERPQRLSEYERRHVTKSYPELTMSEDLVIDDCAYTMGKTSEKLIERNDEIFYLELRKIQRDLTDEEKATCAEMADLDDIDLVLFNSLVVFMDRFVAERNSNRVDSILRVMEEPTIEDAMKKLARKKYESPPLIVKLVQLSPGYFLVFDGEHIKIEGSFKHALLALIAITKLADLQFHSDVEDVLSFFWLSYGLDRRALITPKKGVPVGADATLRAIHE